MQNYSKVRSKKTKFLDSPGFTLVEILLVITIIGILAAVIFVSIGRSDTANLRATQQTAKSIMPFVQECYFKRDDLIDPDDDHDGGGEICDKSTANWPALSIEGCEYSVTDPASGEFEVSNCDNISGRIECKVSLGGCEIVEVP